MTRIEIRSNPHIQRVSCAICLCCFDLAALVAMLVLPDGTADPVCDVCAGRSVEVIRERLQWQLARARAWVDTLDAAVAGPVDMPTPAAVAALRASPPLEAHDYTPAVNDDGPVF